ncbi:MAG: hypothetical protein Q8R02_21000 [Hyphomonadaceae bacterium]|nr:hypothetical protein [Hyphomonadaceae bacterium]
MKRSPLAFMLATLCGLAPFADAQLKKAPSPAGEWGFKTEKMGYGCALFGEISIKQTTDKSYSCSFKAVWGCELRQPKSVETDQSCVATQAGSDITITSKIEKITRVDPADMMDFMRRRYAADHFAVKINTRGDEMDGIFHSYGQAPVKFRRKHELVS